MNSTPERVQITVDGPIATITLDRPDRHNGVDLAMLDAILRAQKAVRGMRDIRAIILRGNGPSFCAGLDFKSVLASRAQAFFAYTQLWWPVGNRFQRWSMGWRAMGAPVIACIHGNCFGAGLQLALGADFRFATPDAQLAVLEAKWGLVPDMGGPTLLRELVPIDVAKELTLTGRIVSGAEAKTLGLVTHVAADPVAAARRLAEEIAARSPDSVAAAKFLLQDAYVPGAYRALRDERVWQRRLFGFANFRISVQRNQQQKDIPFLPRRVKR